MKNFQKKANEAQKEVKELNQERVLMVQMMLKNGMSVSQIVKSISKSEEEIIIPTNSIRYRIIANSDSDIFCILLKVMISNTFLIAPFNVVAGKKYSPSLFRENVIGTLLSVSSFNE